MDRENFLKLLKAKTEEKIPDEVAFENGFQLFYQYLISLFNRKEDEVALFILDDREILKFLYPTFLRKSGAIPKNYRKSFVWKLISQKKGFIDNEFDKAEHLKFFESVREKRYVRPEERKKERPPVAIQKIIGVPLMKGEKVFGAVEVSKKGETPEEAGDDFTQEDLKKLEDITRDVTDILFSIYKRFILNK